MKISENLLDVLPEWAVFLILAALVTIALEAGFRAGRSARGASDGSEDAGGMAIGAVLGLLSFLLAFTFGIAAAHYEARRGVILDEANAIGTAYLRAGLVEGPVGAALTDKIRDYAMLNLSFTGVELSDAERAATRDRMVELERSIWADAAAVAKKEPTAVNGLLISSINEVFDMSTKRVMLGTNLMIPKAIWFSLVLIALIGVASAGYMSGYKSAGRPLLVIGLILSLATVMTLIVDLDNPRSGLLRTSQAPLKALLEGMQ